MPSGRRRRADRHGRRLRPVRDATRPRHTDGPAPSRGGPIDCPGSTAVGATAVSPADFCVDRAALRRCRRAPAGRSRRRSSRRSSRRTSIGSSIKTSTTPSSRGCSTGSRSPRTRSAGFPMSAGSPAQIMIFYNFGERIVAQHHVQHRRLARRHDQLRRGPDQCRRRYRQRVHPARHRQWNFWLSPLPPLPPIRPLAAEPETRRV